MKRLVDLTCCHIFVSLTLNLFIIKSRSKPTFLKCHKSQWCPSGTPLLIKRIFLNYVSPSAADDFISLGLIEYIIINDIYYFGVHSILICSFGCYLSEETHIIAIYYTVTRIVFDCIDHLNSGHSGCRIMVFA